MPDTFRLAKEAAGSVVRYFVEFGQDGDLSPLEYRFWDILFYHKARSEPIFSDILA